MNRLNRVSELRLGFCFALFITFIHSFSALAQVIFLEQSGQVVVEAENFTSRTGDSNGNNWFVVPDETTGAGPFISSARGGKYIQSLPDTVSGGGVLVAPSIEYKMRINTTGTYRLFVRWDGNNSNPNESDSIFVDIVELKDGGGGAIADWYELVEFVNGSLGSPAWDGEGVSSRVSLSLATAQ